VHAVYETAGAQQKHSDYEIHNIIPDSESFQTYCKLFAGKSESEHGRNNDPAGA
jgi:hypothetical protein